MSEEIPGSKKVDLANIRYIISDWDGTLVDSMPAYVQCFIKALEGFNIDPGQLEEYYMSTAGTVLSRQIKEAAKRFAGRDIDDTKALEGKFFEHYMQMGEIEVVDGARETLRYLKENGLKVVVWSGTRTDIIGKKLEQTGLLQYVDFFIGNMPGDDRLVKGPGLFEEIAKHFNVSVDRLQREAVVMGDGVGDIETGKNSGTRTIGLGPQREKLAEAGADFVIGDIRELPELLNARSPNF